MSQFALAFFPERPAWRSRSSQPWGEAEIDYLVYWRHPVREVPYRVLAQELGRSNLACRLCINAEKKRNPHRFPAACAHKRAGRGGRKKTSTASTASTSTTGGVGIKKPATLAPRPMDLAFICN